MFLNKFEPTLGYFFDLLLYDRICRFGYSFRFNTVLDWRRYLCSVDVIFQ